MEHISRWVTFTTLLLLAAGGAYSAAANASDDLMITDAWARSVSHGVANGAVYLTIKNQGQSADTLLGASSDVAARTELHESRMVQGMMQMRPLSPVALAPGEAVTFAPGAKHVMLVGLMQALAVGDTHQLTLNFAKAGAVTVPFTVREAAGMGGARATMDHGNRGHGDKSHGNKGDGNKGHGMAMPKQN